MGRPSFSSLVANLSQPGKQNLMQSEADQSGEPQDRELEEPLESGTTLYSLL